MVQVFNHAITGFMDAYVNNGSIWFVDGSSGAVYKYRIKSNELTLSNLLNTNSKCLRMLPRRIINHEGYLYFISTLGYIIYRGSLIGDSVVVDSVCEIETASDIRIIDAFLINDKIWYIPARLNQKVMIYDIKNEKSIQYNSLYSELERCNIAVEGMEIITIKYVDKNFFFTLETGTEIIQYNIFNRAATRHKIPNKIQVGGFVYDGEYFYIRDKYGVSIHKWILDSEIFESYFLENMNELEKSERDAKTIILSDGQVILLPWRCNSVVYLDKNENCLKRIQGIENLSHVSGKEKYTFSIGNAEIDGKLILYPWSVDKLIFIDLTNMKAETYDLTIDEKDYEKLQWIYWKTKKLIYETDENTLSMQLKRLRHPMLENNEMNEGQQTAKKDVGKEIYKLTAKVLED